ncbi:putative carboxypeptidase [Pseudocercospora fuligena]|uniref:Putative carboxypeptidase n=1 Tax=Pseudocercospora fuligena TaxID=685502 RepID=A0A8H6RD63_9PEZI|nr:putative carboxypeptidase [Pseudocercospora fuligena]
MFVSPWLLALSLSSLASTAKLPQEALQAEPELELLLTDDLIGFHKKLVEIESISGNEKAIGDWLSDALVSQGYHTEKQYLSKDPERFNVYAWPGHNRDAPVVLSSHIDTVPPFLPYKYTENDGNATIFGRGTVDDKGSVAAQVIAVNKLINAKKISADDVALLFVVGEEVGGDGMRKSNDLGLTPKAIIFGEPTEGKLVSGHKGVMQIVLTAKGKNGHSGYPWLGRSANEILVSALATIMHLPEKLPQSDKYGLTTFNLGRIEGGVAANVIAESATASITVRVAAGEPKDLEKAITKAVHHSVKGFLEDHLEPEDVIDVDFATRGYGPVDIDADVPGFDVFTVNYGTDIPNWDQTDKDQKRYLYGPGTIFVAHSDHEEITVKDLETAVDDYQKIVLHALGKSDSAKQDL